MVVRWLYPGRKTWWWLGGSTQVARETWFGLGGCTQVGRHVGGWVAVPK